MLDIGVFLGDNYQLFSRNTDKVSQMADDTNDENAALDLSGLGSFDFTPDWAKGRSDDKSRYARFEGRDDDRSGDKPSGDRRQGGSRKPFDRERKPFDRERKPFDRERKPFGDRGQRRDDRPRREFVKPLDVDVRILPSQKELGPIIRQLQTKHTAYALKQLAYLFLDNPSACMLRITPKKDAAEPLSPVQGLRIFRVDRRRRRGPCPCGASVGLLRFRDRGLRTAEGNFHLRREMRRYR